MAYSRLRTNTYLSFWRVPLAIGIVVAVLDQITKQIVMRVWDRSEQTVVIPGLFNLVHFRNPGAAWGMFGDHTLWLAGLSVVVLVALILRFDRLVEGYPERALALGAVSGGILGNLIDRVAYRAVVDFLLFYWRSYQWPAFNVADSAISCGVAVFIVSSFLRQRAEEEGLTSTDQAGYGKPGAPDDQSKD